MLAAERAALSSNRVMGLFVDTPLGMMRAAFDDFGRLTELEWLGDSLNRGELNETTDATACLQAVLDAYFASRPIGRQVELAPRGTPFQKSVWEAVSAIPPGATATYGEIAVQLRSPKAARAVGLANARNPIAILIPCHRLVGRDGGLRGYAGGLNRKQSLLDLEARG